MFFDFDGFLVESDSFYYKQMTLVFRKYKKKTPSLRTFKKEVSALGVEGFYEKHGIFVPFRERQEIERGYRKEHLHELRIRHEAHVLFAICRTFEIKMAILSSNRIGIIRRVLKQSHLQVDEIYSSRDKSRSLIEIIKHHHLKPKRVAFGGDTKDDILAGKKAKVITIGFSNGYHTHEQIIEANPTFGGKEGKISSLLEVAKIILENR